MLKNEILENLFFIERGYLNANHFAYRSESPVLIDTGYISDFRETENLVSGLGINLSDVSLIINTHTHCDHIGGNTRIQKKSGCGIALHKVGKHFIDSRDNWSTWWKYYNQEATFFNCTAALTEGDRISVGPHEFDVLYTPGHASDGIVLYHPKEKILISSDTLWENDMAVMTLRVEGSLALFQMQHSLERLDALDVKKVYPGHGKPFTDMAAAISKTRKKIELYLQDREHIGNDLIKKIIIYTLLMKKGFNETDFFPYLMGTIWFKETIDLYFNSAYDIKYHEIMTAFFKRGIVCRDKGDLSTTIKP